MSESRPPWLTSSPPWHAPISEAACRLARVAPSEVPLVELPSTPCSAAELVALRNGRYVPLFGHGASAAEVRRALALVHRAFAANADPRASDHALTMLVHPALGAEPIRLLGMAAVEGRAPSWSAALVLGLAGTLGASDVLRADVGRALSAVPSLSTEVALAVNAGGGDLHAWRDHYQRLRASDAEEPPVRAVSVARHWYDFVLARRWSGVDGLRAMNLESLDASSQWLAASAEWVSGEERARARMTDLAHSLLEPLQKPLPRLAQAVAREMVELLAHPWSVRWEHLRCAASRDHASASIRAWLHAATEERIFEEPDASAGAAEYGELGPEPSRAGRAAAEARQLAGDFLLDWFVPERDARVAVDAWARTALRVYHRLRGAALVEVALRGARADGTRLDDLLVGGAA